MVLDSWISSKSFAACSIYTQPYTAGLAWWDEHGGCRMYEGMVQCGRRTRLVANFMVWFKHYLLVVVCERSFLCEFGLQILPRRNVR